MNLNVKTNVKTLTIFFMSLILLYVTIFSVAYFIATPVTELAAISAFFWTFIGSELLVNEHNAYDNELTWFETFVVTLKASFLGPLNYLYTNRLT
jgi:hypothetical protein